MRKKKVIDIGLVIVIAIILTVIFSNLLPDVDKILIFLIAAIVVYYVYTETPVGNSIYNTIF